MTDSERLTALEDAYFDGARSVTIDGQRIEYASMAELWQAIERLRARLAPTTRPPIVSMRPTVYNRGRR